MSVSDRIAAVAYIALMGASHAAITWFIATGPSAPINGYLCAGACITIWLLFWSCYRYDRRSQGAPARPRWSAGLWRDGKKPVHDFTRRVERMERERQVKIAVRKAQEREWGRKNEPEPVTIRLLQDWLLPQPPPDDFHTTCRRAIRALARNRRRNRDADL